jgi:hypothetical protein
MKHYSPIKPKYFVPLFYYLLLLMFAACNTGNNGALQVKTDSLTQQLANTYKPGLGEFMMGVQVHHAKIWFAGINHNWALAGFEVGEIKETLEDVKKYCTDRPEVKTLPIIYPALDSISNAIQSKNLLRFKASFIMLTNSCNTCHQNTNHAFNVIKIPDTPPFTNQEYKPR